MFGIRTLGFETHAKKLCGFIVSLLCTDAMIERLFSLKNNFWKKNNFWTSETKDLPIFLGEITIYKFFKTRLKFLLNLIRYYPFY